MPKQFTEALNILRENKSPAVWLGRNPFNWAGHIGCQSSGIPTERLNRKQLQEFCSNQAYSARECIASICGWGGMKVDHGKLLFEKCEYWLPLVEELRFRGFCRKIAYQKFKDLRKNQMLPGCGPAYFTKFIFFRNGGKKSNPQHNGFIMDQWTVKSIQLLTGERRPYLSSAGYVNDDNTGEDYEFYCHTIEELASELRFQDPDMAEEAIFSSGGRNSAAWRRYVKRNWHSP